MDFVELGTTGIKISRIALGCWAFGGDRFWGPQEDLDSVKTVQAALDLGVNFMDTAEGYGDAGRSENVLGRALRGKRDRAVVATKAYGKSLAEKSVVEACENSLKRLQTDYIDLYYIHWPNPEIPVEETVRGMERLIETGKVRCLGISNFGPENLAKLKATGKIDLFAVHQVPYNLFWRAIEHEVKPATTDCGMGIVAYSTLAQGLLTGLYSSAAEVPDHLKVTRFYDARHVNADHGETGCEGEVFAALDSLRQISSDSALSLPALSFAWLFAQKGVSSLLSGARTPEEIEHNVGVMDISVSEQIINELTSLSEAVKEKIGGNPDMWMGGTNSRYR